MIILTLTLKLKSMIFRIKQVVKHQRQSMASSGKAINIIFVFVHQVTFNIRIMNLIYKLMLISSVSILMRQMEWIDAQVYLDRYPYPRQYPRHHHSYLSTHHSGHPSISYPYYMAQTSPPTTLTTWSSMPGSDDDELAYSSTVTSSTIPSVTTSSKPKHETETPANEHANITDTEPKFGFALSVPLTQGGQIVDMTSAGPQIGTVTTTTVDTASVPSQSMLLDPVRQAGEQIKLIWRKIFGSNLTLHLLVFKYFLELVIDLYFKSHE